MDLPRQHRLWPLHGARGWGGGLACLLLIALLIVLAPQGAPAQEVPAPADPPAGAPPGLPADVALVPATPIVTLDQDRFFKDSAYGKAALARAETDASALSAENRKLEAALEAEEQDLTARRAALKPGEFAPLAAAFDTKVEEIRSAQDAKSRAITRRLEENRQHFFESAVPVLADLLRDTGAVAILADNAIILSLSALDITDEAVARMDVAMPDLPPEAGEGPADPGPPVAPDPDEPLLQGPAPTPVPGTIPPAAP